MASRVKIADIYAALAVDGLKQYDEGMDKVEARAKKAAEAVAQVGQALLGLGVVLTGLAAVAVKAAMAEEDVKDQLDAMYGSAEAGTRVLTAMRGVADKTGVGLGKLGDAVTVITTQFGDNEEQTKRLIGPFTDLAKYMGVDIPTAVASLGRAYAGGASDTIALRGPVLALIKDYAKLHYGMSDISKMALPEFREMLLKFLQDPTTKFAGHAAKVAEGLGGTFDRLKVKVSEVSASFGRELAPALDSALGWLIKLADAFGRLPADLKSTVTWVGALTGGFALLSGGLLTMLPKFLSFVLTLKQLQGVLVGVGGLGLIGALGALALAMHKIDVDSRGAGEAARELASGGAKLEKQLAVAEAQARKAAASYGDGAAVTVYWADKVAELTAELAALGQGQIAEVTATGSAVDKATAGVQKFNELAWAGYEAEQMMLDRFNEQWDRLARGITPEVAQGDVWQTLPLKVDEKVKKTIDWFGALQQAAGAAGESIGRAFADMAAGAEVNVGKVIEQVVKLIAKLLIMAALYAIPGVGPILSQFAGGFLGAVGFDNPVSDSQAFRWGMDFSRQFGAGVNAMLGNGLTLPQMQPAAIGGMGGGMAFDVHVHNATPDTYVSIVRKAVKSMGSADLRGTMRDGLGRAYDDWNDR